MKPGRWLAAIFMMTVLALGVVVLRAERVRLQALAIRSAQARLVLQREAWQWQMRIAWERNPTHIHQRVADMVPPESEAGQRMRQIGSTLSPSNVRVSVASADLPAD